MDEYSRLLRNYTVITIIILLIMIFVAASFIAGFKVDYNITGEEQPKISYYSNSEQI